MATERYPLLREVFERRNNLGGNTRLILVGFIAVLGLFALASRGGMLTIPILVVIGVVVFNFRRLERQLSGGASAWRRFLGLVDDRSSENSPMIGDQLEAIERELSGESIEWSRITMTENYIFWPRMTDPATADFQHPKELDRGHVTLIKDITLLHVELQDGMPDDRSRHGGLSASADARRDSHHFMCDTRHAGERLTLSLDEAESGEIIREIVARHPDVQIDPLAYSYFYPPG